MTQTELLNTIRAEIERRKEILVNCNTHFFKGRLSAYKDILAFLDTLPEQPVEEVSRPIPRCGIGRHFFMVEKTNKEQPVEGLEEEIERFYRTDEYRIADTLGRGFETLARHFAEWGAEHLKK